MTTTEQLKNKFKEWQGGESGFYQWLSDIKPRILTRSNSYEVFEPTVKQQKFICKMLETDKNGRFKRSFCLNIEPRRHGKSTVFALVVIWIFTTRRNQTIQLLGSSEDHCRRVQFRTLQNIIFNSEKLARMIPEKNHSGYAIKFPALGNVIQFQANNPGSSFGDKVNLLWTSDLHSFIELAAFNALQASLLDSEDALILIDSNVDSTGGHVHDLQNAAVEDASMLCNYTTYRDLAHYCKAAPEWIDRAKAKRLQKTTLPADFARDILGQRLDAKNQLFSNELIERAESDYRVPVADVQAITRGRAYKIGGGLDRAKNLVAIGRGDSTVWTCILKVAQPDGEPEYFILNQHVFKINSDRAIKNVILEDHKKYNLDHVTLENYEVSGIFAWLQDQKISAEMIHPSDSTQNAAFPEMYRIFADGRFRFSADLEKFKDELSHFAYFRRNNGMYSFAHSSHHFHDDTVFSTAWAVYSLRAEVLSTYVIEDILCTNRSGRRHFCYLLGGDLILHCSRDCPAAVEVADYYKEFLAMRPDTEMTLASFFQSFVKINGAVISQAV